MTFFGIITYVFATSTETSKCQEVTALKGLNPTKFYKGTWYVTHARNPTAPLTCVKYYTSESQGDTLIIKYDNNEGAKQIGHCETSKEMKEDQKVPFICTSNGSDNIQLEVKLIYTDYENFGVFYRCIKTGDTFIEDNFLALSRKRTSEEIPEFVKSLLPKQVSFSKCPSIPEA
uniref:Pc188, similar to salivary lipocalin n=1 Tax=Panstrongylus chinai TaxID=156444 RepID=A0A286P0X2_9HEMI|nr:Pc188, similar to salivary lipocalin [Panstrongylus chinai]